MSKHEEFDELCALAATGQLSPAEESRLSEHLDECESCRRACGDFAAILRELPAPERGPLNRGTGPKIDEKAFREKFLARGGPKAAAFPKRPTKLPLILSGRFLDSCQRTRQLLVA